MAGSNMLLATAKKYIVGLFFCCVALFFTIIHKAKRKYIRKVTDDPRELEKYPKILDDPKWGTHAYAKLKDIRIHYVANGDSSKPLMLFIHGYPEFWYSWRYQLEEFSKDYYVVAPDMRGYADSDRPKGIRKYKLECLLDDIRQLIEELGKKRCILAGHDWGGLQAWAFAAKYPQIVDKLIICNVPNLPAFYRHWSQSKTQQTKSRYIQAYQTPFLPEMLISMSLPFLFHMAFYTTEESKKYINETDIQAFQYTFAKPGALTGPINYYRANFDFIADSSDDVNLFGDFKITSPTLMIWGKMDRYLESEMAKLSGEYVADFTLKMIEDGSHWIQQDRPHVVNQHIREFLSESSDC